MSDMSAIAQGLSGPAFLRYLHLLLVSVSVIGFLIILGFLQSVFSAVFAVINNFSFSQCSGSLRV